MNSEKGQENTTTVIELSEEGSVKQEIKDEEIEENPTKQIPTKTWDNNQHSRGNWTKSVSRINVAMPSGVNVVIINGIKIVK